MTSRMPPALLDASESVPPGRSTSTTSVRLDEATGESIISFGNAEVLGPPLRLEEPTAVLGTQVARPPEVPDPDVLARTGDEVGALTALGASLILVGAVLRWRAQPSAGHDGDAPASSPLTIRWLEGQPTSSGGLTLRFL